MPCALISFSRSLSVMRASSTRASGVPGAACSFAYCRSSCAVTGSPSMVATMRLVISARAAPASRTGRTSAATRTPRGIARPRIMRRRASASVRAARRSCRHDPSRWAGRAAQLAHCLLEQVRVELEADRRDVPRLLLAEQVPGAADLEVVGREAEAAAQVVELLQDAETLLRLGRDQVLARYQ